MSWRCLRRRSLLTLLFLILVAARGEAQPAPGPARVEGAEALNVRTGPGLDDDVVGSLRRGDTVQVREVQGKWARITYRDGEGWVFARFVVAQPGATAIADSTPSPDPTATTASDSVAAVDPPVVVAPPDGAIASTEAIDEIRGDVDRILTLTEAVHHELERQRNSPPSASQGEDGISYQSGFGLLALGAVVGFLIGSILGRQQERRGRPRVRL